MLPGSETLLSQSTGVSIQSYVSNGVTSSQALQMERESYASHVQLLRRTLASSTQPSSMQSSPRWAREWNIRLEKIAKDIRLDESLHTGVGREDFLPLSRQIRKASAVIDRLRDRSIDHCRYPALREYHKLLEKGINCNRDDGDDGTESCDGPDSISAQVCVQQEVLALPALCLPEKD